mmetsp:Transcript_103878/g.294301  ORF Transcript_103878/g.294301 Transcript_103878/m.294301 type:complete len:334 (-) Transcript_103878:800-1801(-)
MCAAGISLSGTLSMAAPPSALARYPGEQRTTSQCLSSHPGCGSSSCALRWLRLTGIRLAEDSLTKRRTWHSSLLESGTKARGGQSRRWPPVAGPSCSWQSSTRMSPAPSSTWSFSWKPVGTVWLLTGCPMCTCEKYSCSEWHRAFSKSSACARSSMICFMFAGAEVMTGLRSRSAAEIMIDGGVSRSSWTMSHREASAAAMMSGGDPKFTGCWPFDSDTAVRKPRSGEHLPCCPHAASSKREGGLPDPITETRSRFHCFRTISVGPHTSSNSLLRFGHGTPALTSVSTIAHRPSLAHFAISVSPMSCSTARWRGPQYWAAGRSSAFVRSPARG